MLGASLVDGNSATSDGFVGRAAELTKLAAAWEQSLAGGRRAVFLSGEPGIGKTRLAIEFAKSVEQDGALVVYGRCDDDPLISYEPFAQVFRQLSLHLSPGARATDATTAKGLADLIPTLSESPWREALLQADPPMRRLLLFEGARSVLRASGELGPLLMILDDLQWADSDTVRLLRYLLRESWGTPALILGLYRDTDQRREVSPMSGVVASFGGRGKIEHLELQPLTVADVRAFLEAHLQSAISSEQSLFVQQASGGNPLFMAQLVSSGERDLKPNALPVGVRDLASQRLAKLSSACRKLLETVAIFGQGAELAYLRALWDGDDEALGACLLEAVHSGLLVEEGTQYRFNHGVVQQVILRVLPLLARERLHLAAARAMGSGPARHSRGGPQEVATHYQKAGDSAPADEALPHALAAGELAVAGSALDEAVGWWEWALTLMEATAEPPATRAKLLERMAGVLDLGREQSRAIRYLERALELREAQGDAAETAVCRSRLGSAHASGNLKNTDLAAARMHFEAAAAVIEGTAGRRVAALHAGWARMGISSFRIEDLDHATAAYGLSSELGWQEVAISSRIALGMLKYHTGESDAALALLAEVQGEARAFGDVAQSGVAAFVGGIAAQRFGDPCFAAALLRPELEGWPAPAAAAPWGIAPRLVSALAEAGDLLGAQSLQHEHTERDEERIESLVERCALAFYEGDWTGPAWREAEVCAANAARRDDRCSCHNLRHWLVPAMRVRGETDRAAAIVEDELVSSLNAGSVAQEIVARAELGLLMAETGEWQAASAHLGRCRQIFPNVSERRGLEGKLLLTECLLSASANNLEAAGAAFGQAIGVVRRYSIPWLEGRVMEDWLLVLSRSRLRSKAASVNRQVAALYRRIGAGDPWLNRLDKLGGLGPIAPGFGLPDGLTAREAEVLRLIARGQSNSEIAGALVLSIRTVERHIANIYDKSGAHTKSQATAYAFRHHLN